MPKNNNLDFIRLPFLYNMAKGFNETEIRQKLVSLLNESKTGLSGIEISEKLGINRMTMTKYLNVFAAEGFVQQKNVGNVHLWFIEEGTEQFDFPNDYFKAQTKYQELLMNETKNQVASFTRNCIFSGATTQKTISEIIMPAIDFVEKLYGQGKIGKSEQKLLEGKISHSIQLASLLNVEINPQKNIIVFSADPQSTLYAEAASISFHSHGWKVSSLGDMSGAIDVLFDLDLQKFLGNIWKQKNGIMIIVIFSDSEDGMKFFSEAINSVKEKIGKKLYLVLCGKMKKNFSIKADLLTENFDDIFQWSQTTFESFNS